MAKSETIVERKTPSKDESDDVEKEDKEKEDKDKEDKNKDKEEDTKKKSASPTNISTEGEEQEPKPKLAKTAVIPSKFVAPDDRAPTKKKPCMHNLYDPNTNQVWPINPSYKKNFW